MCVMHDNSAVEALWYECTCEDVTGLLHRNVLSRRALTSHANARLINAMLITKPKSSSEQFIVVCIHLSEWWPNLFLLLLRKNAAKWQNIIFLLEAEHD